MSRLPASPDIRRLVEDGFSVMIGDGYLAIRDVPYVDGRRRVRRGVVVSSLDLAGDETRPPRNHIAYFGGDLPCDSQGRPLQAVTQREAQRDWGGGVVTDHVMCSLSVDGEFRDYHDKMTLFVAQIANHAEVLDPTATARTGRVMAAEPRTSCFAYVDTASARAGIGGLVERLVGHSVGIVGVGGTGSYILDLIAKTPVSRIHIVDPDVMLQHNAFRMPGAPSAEDLAQGRSKVAHLDRIYSRMHTGILPHRARLGPGTFQLLDHMDFVFLCIDEARSKKAIVAELERRDLPFVDVGMGLNLTEAGLVGAVRVTTSTPVMRAHVWDRGRIPMTGGVDDDPYSTNIQVSDLNMLNAALAVVRWKRLLGFYADFEGEHFSAYTIDGNHMVNEERAGPPAHSGG